MSSGNAKGYDPKTGDEIPPPAAPNVSITGDQVRAAIAAGLEVLSGAEPAKVLQLADQLPACKLVMRGIASGELVVVRPGPAPQPSRKERRAAAAAARRTSKPGK